VCSIAHRAATYLLRPRYGADFGPQICINDRPEGLFPQPGNLADRVLRPFAGALHREDRPVPKQYAGPDADQRCELEGRGPGNRCDSQSNNHRLDAAERPARATHHRRQQARTAPRECSSTGPSGSTTTRLARWIPRGNPDVKQPGLRLAMAKSQIRK